MPITLYFRRMYSLFVSDFYLWDLYLFIGIETFEATQNLCFEILMTIMSFFSYLYLCVWTSSVSQEEFYDCQVSNNTCVLNSYGILKVSWEFMLDISISKNGFYAQWVSN